MMLMRMKLWLYLCANHPSRAPPLFREMVGGFLFDTAEQPKYLAYACVESAVLPPELPVAEWQPLCLAGVVLVSCAKV